MADRLNYLISLLLTKSNLGSIKRLNAETVGVVTARPIDDYNNQGKVALLQTAAIKEFNDNYRSKYNKETKVENYAEGDTESITKSFQELGIAFLLAIILTYLVLVLFFNSFTQPLVILFAIPLTFIGIFPALHIFVGGQLGFLEIIGIIILVGLVENVAIFLIDAANQKIKEGWEPKEAISYASAIRFRPILLTKITTLVSTAPLAILSEFYRSISVVIIFGLLTSGILSLFISPILFIYFRFVSHEFRSYPAWGKILFLAGLPIFPVALLGQWIVSGMKDRKLRKK
jgi:multidrug efflux pump subunit AcrB